MSQRCQRNAVAKPNHVLERQRASLERLAARVGVTRHQLEQLTERDTAAGLGHFLAQNAAVVDRFGSFAGLSKLDFKSFIADKAQACDFWTDLITREQYTHEFAIQAICKVAKDLPINWPYITKIAHQHGLPIPTHEAKSMRAFLERIPCAYLFDHEFNAFIEWNETSLVPCVFYNTLLLDSLTEVAQLMSLSFANAGSYAGLTEVEVRSRTLVMVERLVGRRLLVKNSHVVEEPSAFLGTLGMAFAAHIFVATHELAHLLLGHDGTKSSVQVECEADMFATLVLGSTTWPNREFAIASVMALIDIIEGDRPVSQSHPRPRDRLRVVGMQAAVAKARIDWNYVCSVLKLVLDDASELCIGRRVFQDCEFSNASGEKGRRVELRRETDKPG